MGYGAASPYGSGKWIGDATAPQCNGRRSHPAWALADGGGSSAGTEEQLRHGGDGDGDGLADP